MFMIVQLNYRTYIACKASAFNWVGFYFIIIFTWRGGGGVLLLFWVCLFLGGLMLRFFGGLVFFI